MLHSRLGNVHAIERYHEALRARQSQRMTEEVTRDQCQDQASSHHRSCNHRNDDGAPHGGCECSADAIVRPTLSGHECGGDLR